MKISLIAEHMNYQGYMFQTETFPASLKALRMGRELNILMLTMAMTQMKAYHDAPAMATIRECLKVPVPLEPEPLFYRCTGCRRVISAGRFICGACKKERLAAESTVN